MAPRLSKEEGDEIDEAIYNDPIIDLNKLAACYRVVYSTIQRRKKKLEEQLYTRIDPRKSAGPSPLVTPEIWQYVEDLIERHQMLYLDEVADYVYMEFDVKLSISIVCRILKSARISYKKIESVAG